MMTWETLVAFWNTLDSLLRGDIEGEERQRLVRRLLLWQIIGAAL